jgi:tripartite-type tricarboxylate transporter receptor subunit TctC
VSGSALAVRLVAAAAVLFLPLRPAAAQEPYPSRPVTVIFPYAAGGPVDPMARALAAGLGARLGQPFVVLNRDGAAGAVGTAAAMRAAPDGYTLAFLPAVVLSVLPVTLPASGIRPEAFVPVCQTFSNDQTLAVRADSPWRSLTDLQAAARAAPGRIAYGSLGHASVPHLAAVGWSRAAGVEMSHVPYRGDAAVIADLLAGRLEVGALVLGSAAGRTDIRPLAVFDTVRNPAFPDVPTAREAGFDVAFPSFGGLFAVAGTPPERVAALEAACAGAVTDEAYRAAARRALQPASHHLGAAAFAARLARDVADKAEVLRTLPLPP